jgi:hypothetical protein
LSLTTWRKRYGELESADVKRLRQIEQESARLKKLLAERDLEINDEGNRPKCMARLTVARTICF